MSSDKLFSIADLQRKQQTVAKEVAAPAIETEVDPAAHNLFDTLRRTFFPVCIMDALKEKGVTPDQMSKMNPMDMHKIVLKAREDARVQTDEVLELICAASSAA